MEDQDKKAAELIERYLQGMCTPEEGAIVEAVYKQYAQQKPFREGDIDFTRIGEDSFLKISATIDTQQRHPVRLWLRVAAAASILLFVSFSGYFIWHKNAIDQTIITAKNDIAPGHSQATLTLANGRKIVLTKGLYTNLTQGATAININNGITYTSGLKSSTKTTSYNTLATANGEQSPYPLILPDGSKVLLNAQSSITFPTAFNGKERIVKITGEAMFEVSHNAKQPFKVQTQTQIIEDIGTIFNVNAYADEHVTKTTLIAGKVKVNNMLLEPGQQTDGSYIKTVNTKRYTAWKNGDFYFEDDSIQAVMRQLSRWYNIQVNYEGHIPTDGFNAQISRSKNISAILQILANTKGVHFKIEGRRITVIE
jgi:ferric-dicitrate binding protein FerR (iron transport regulator)